MNVTTVTYETERVASRLRYVTDDDLLGDVEERLRYAIDRCVAARPDAVLVRGSLDIDAEDHVKRRWLPAVVGVGALQSWFLFPLDRIETEWRASALAFVNVDPEDRDTLGSVTLAPGVRHIRLARPHGRGWLSALA